MKTADYVWGIGLSKTGTTSLHEALKILGYNSIHFPYRFPDIEGYNSASDIPVLLWFEELDKKYPNSKFIWTERDISSWLLSCNKYWTNRSNRPQRILEIRQECYNSLAFDEQLFRDAYYCHGARVMDYFKERRDDLLILNISKGEGWEKLCPFIGKPIPDRPFPHVNQAPKKKFFPFLSQVVKKIITF